MERILYDNFYCMGGSYGQGGRQWTNYSSAIVEGTATQAIHADSGVRVMMLKLTCCQAKSTMLDCVPLPSE